MDVKTKPPVLKMSEPIESKQQENQSFLQKKYLFMYRKD